METRKTAMRFNVNQHNHQGFTLAELLIALTVLAVIATFTIPKILQANQQSQWNSAAKEMAATLSNVLMLMNADGTFTPAVSKAGDFLPYLNYLSIDSVNLMDNVSTGTTIDCSFGNYKCLRIANGGVLYFWSTDTICGNKKPEALPFYFDPDGKVADGTPNGVGKAVKFWLYGDGTVRTQGTAEPNTHWANPVGCAFGSYTNAVPLQDPPWFSWN